MKSPIITGGRCLDGQLPQSCFFCCWVGWLCSGPSTTGHCGLPFTERRGRLGRLPVKELPARMSYAGRVLRESVPGTWLFASRLRPDNERDLLCQEFVVPDSASHFCIPCKSATVTSHDEVLGSSLRHLRQVHLHQKLLCRVRGRAGFKASFTQPRAGFNAASYFAIAIVRFKGSVKVCSCLMRVLHCLQWRYKLFPARPAPAGQWN